MVLEKSIGSMRLAPPRDTTYRGAPDFRERIGHKHATEFNEKGVISARATASNLVLQWKSSPKRCSTILRPTNKSARSAPSRSM